VCVCVCVCVCSATMVLINITTVTVFNSYMHRATVLINTRSVIVQQC
jgi:hypothetical protein